MSYVGDGSCGPGTWLRTESREPKREEGSLRLPCAVEKTRRLPVSLKSVLECISPVLRFLLGRTCD